MANHEWQADRPAYESPADAGWVDDRLAALSTDRDWVPDAARTLARLRARAGARRVAAQRWIWTTVAAAGVMATLLLIPASRACAQQPGVCVQRVLGITTAPGIPAPAPSRSVAPSRESTDPPAGRAVAAIERAPGGASHVAATAAANFKEAGSPSAPVCMEVYLDYECPHCEAFIRDVLPSLTAQYVATGKVRLLYRDYPMPTHRYARLAARYADAAGELGYYDVVMQQLFTTRRAWSESGDIDSEAAQVLPAEVMEKVRDRVRSDPHLDDALLADLASAQADHLDRTPFAVLVYRGKREIIPDAPISFESLKDVLDRLQDR